MPDYRSIHADADADADAAAAHSAQNEHDSGSGSGGSGGGGGGGGNSDGPNAATLQAGETLVLRTQGADVGVETLSLRRTPLRYLKRTFGRVGRLFSRRRRESGGGGGGGGDSKEEPSNPPVPTPAV